MRINLKCISFTFIQQHHITQVLANGLSFKFRSLFLSRCYQFKTFTNNQYDTSQSLEQGNPVENNDELTQETQTLRRSNRVSNPPVHFKDYI